MDKLCDQAFDKMCDYLRKDCNKCVLEKELLDPMIAYIGNRLYPYIITASVAIFVLLCVLCYLLVLTLKVNRLHFSKTCS